MLPGQTGVKIGLFGDVRACGPRSSHPDPALQMIDLGIGQHAPQGHLQLLVADGLDDEALFRVAGNQGGPSKAALQEGLAGIDSERRELLLGAVAGVTVFDQQRADLRFEEIHGFAVDFGAGRSREQEAATGKDQERQQKQTSQQAEPDVRSRDGTGNKHASYPCPHDSISSCL